MGVTGDVLRHKRWHLWNPDNLDRVKRDVQAHQEKLQQAKDDVRSRESEYRMQQLRDRTKRRRLSPTRDLVADILGPEPSTRSGISSSSSSSSSTGGQSGHNELWHDKTNRCSFVKKVAAPDMSHAVNKGQQEPIPWWQKGTDCDYEYKGQHRYIKRAKPSRDDKDGMASPEELAKARRKEDHLARLDPLAALQRLVPRSEDPPPAPYPAPPAPNCPDVCTVTDSDASDDDATDIIRKEKKRVRKEKKKKKKSEGRNKGDKKLRLLEELKEAEAALKVLTASS